ncbi:universal stress protein [Dactylosporangium sp. NBC_01737]|uniref:universal stress protein n=1 Tax=Dactylosporangium sp. NBC_01737 TaxID=2975959 RepID=UPI002E104F1C|nr:universal stress protein [Dactylosporangium sp. NBC_01737]
MGTPQRPARQAPADRIGVGFAGTPGGRAALAWAVEETAARSATLTICHAGNDGHPHVAATDLVDLELRRPVLARQLRAARQRLHSRSFVELPAGDTAEALLDLSRRVDLLVVGGHDGGDPLHHAVPTRLAAQASCPVVVVRPAVGRGPFAGHVVVGADGSTAAAAALRAGFAHAELHHVPLVVVEVDGRRPGGDFWFDDRFLETHFATVPASLETLAEQVEPLLTRHPSVAVKRAVYGGEPVTGLRRAAAGARLLVLGRHGRRLPAVLRLGSVSRAFAEHADGVVEIVPDDTA